MEHLECQPTSRSAFLGERSELMNESRLGGQRETWASGKGTAHANGLVNNKVEVYKTPDNTWSPNTPCWEAVL
jgi:hypothetical protein